MPSAKDNEVLAAIDGWNAGLYSSKRAAARAHGVNHRTMLNRMAGVPSRHHGHSNQQTLSIPQEEFLVQWILQLEKEGHPPRQATVKDMATQIRRIAGETPTIGNNWVSRFLQRHPEVQSMSLSEENISASSLPTQPCPSKTQTRS